MDSTDDITDAQVAALPPIFISVEQAAKMLGVSKWLTYQLLDEGAMEDRYIGRRRLVDVKSLYRYAAGLPTEGPGPKAAGA